jgi:uncharacterized protein YegP (UPF0339 family)
MGRKFELFKDRKGEFRWRLISSQKIIATSGEGYSKKAGARQGIRAVVKAITGTKTECDLPVVDLTVKIVTKKPTKKTATATKGAKKSATKKAAKKTAKKK